MYSTRLLSISFIAGISFSIITPTRVEAENYSFQRVAKSQPDECFTGKGMPYHSIRDCSLPADPGDVRIPKRNHTYPWAMVQSHDEIWIGTGANTAFLAQAAAGSIRPMLIPGELVVEGPTSQYPVFGNRPFLSSIIQKAMGDWRPPQVWIYNVKSGVQERVRFEAPELLETVGLRAAGTQNGIVLLAGPQASLSGIVLFAFDAATHQYLGSEIFADYGDIRTFVTVGTTTYTGVKTRDGRGEVLRWRGNRLSPFAFEVVARLDNDAANLTVHDNHLIVGTWSNSALSGLSAPIEVISDLISPGPHSAIWMSPTLQQDGSLATGGDWRQLWSVDDYEPDESIAGSYGIGAMSSFQGCLYWGTMNPPFSGFTAVLKKNPIAILSMREESMKNGARLISIFRLCDVNAGTNGIELLYGESWLPRFFPPRLFELPHWSLVPNMMGGRPPLFGSSGIGRPGTYYAWSSKVFDGKLFMGTMEHPMPGETVDRRGANLWAFTDHDHPADLINDSGLTTPLNEGIRNMLVIDDALYLGMTNSANLSPEGGWEVIRLKAEVTP